VSSTQLFPEIIDGSTLGTKASSPVFLPIGIEGVMADDGEATVGELLLISRASDAVTQFGAASTLTALINYVLDRGAGPVWAIASSDDVATVTTILRQAAWQTMEAKREIRIRLTDASVVADLVALGSSCNNANMLNNKQFCIVGLPAATSKANQIADAVLIAAADDEGKRSVLVAPGVYDENGTLISGSFAAASVAAMVAQNSDASDDLDTVTLPKLTAIEQTSLGLPVYRSIVVAGVVVNDFEDLLQAGVSPLMPGVDGGVAISHLRMTNLTAAWDSLMTRVIMDQLFVLVRDSAIRFNSLRKGNTPTRRDQLASRIDALLKANDDIVQPVELGDGSTGYGVTVTGESRQNVISYQGEIVRGASTILVDANLSIAA
jgi:hypothetical protein